MLKSCVLNSTFPSCGREAGSFDCELTYSICFCTGVWSLSGLQEPSGLQFVILGFGVGGNGSYVWGIKRIPLKVGNLFLIMAASDKNGEDVHVFKANRKSSSCNFYCYSTLKPLNHD